MVLIAYSRVGMVEGFLLAALAFLFLMLALLWKGYRVGVLVGLSAVLCIATKYNVTIVLAAAAVAGLVAIIAEKRQAGCSWLAAFRRLGVAGIVIGAVFGVAVLWFVAIRGQEAAWIATNRSFVIPPAKHISYAVYVLRNFIMLPTHSDAVLVVIGPLAVLAAAAAIKALAQISTKSYPHSRTGLALSYETFISIVFLVSIPPFVLSVPANSGVTGRHTMILFLPLLLLAASLFTDSPALREGFTGLSRKGRLLVLTAAFPILFVAGRAFYSQMIQGALALAADRPWFKPLVLQKDWRLLIVDFGPFTVLFGAILLLAMVRPQYFRLRGLAVALLAIAIVTQGILFVPTFGRHDYACLEASRAIGLRIPQGTPVLGTCAVTLDRENQIKALFVYPSVKANKDEKDIKAWNAPFAVVSGKERYDPGDRIQWERLSPRWQKPSDFWRLYNRVVACYPMRADPFDYGPEDWGYYILLAKDDPTVSASP